MTTLVVSQSQSSIQGWLRESALEVRQVGDRCWQLQLESVAVRVTASVDDPFLHFDAPAPGAYELAQTSRLLQLCAALAGNAKFALVPNPWQLRLRAEVAIADDSNTQARIAEALHGLKDAHGLVTSELSQEALSTQAAVAVIDAGSVTQDLFSLLRETGWAFQERSSGVASVDLAMRGESCRMLVEADSGGMRARIEFLQTSSIAPTSKRAVVAMLLGASGSLRLARPYVLDSSGQFACGFEVQFAGETIASELEHALEALAVACWACKLEVHSLLDNSVAESYLAIRNLPPTLATEEF
jgi:hypothetical protein